MPSKLGDLQDIPDFLPGSGSDHGPIDRKTGNSLALAAVCLSALMLEL
ncbi:hypothetical protein MKK65_20510 [Methylobacterium sp. J-001]|nr:hypothetical protein [Methylobacterium sp. J-001]MCJ2118918.1 hypothetical protein [Methylobacterium sp. J-001]